MTEADREVHGLSSARRRLLVAAIAIVALLVAVKSLDRAQPVHFYRVIDDRTIGVEAESGPASWTRVTSVTETETSVTIKVSSLAVSLTGSEAPRPTELEVTLAAPLGDRAVIDGTTGATMQSTTCPEWMSAQGSCTGRASPSPTP
jgi:hypothetical protein